MQMFSTETSAIYRGKRVRFSAHVKSSGVLTWAGLWMRVDGRSGEDSLAFDNMQGRPIKGTTDWKQYQVVLDVPAAATAVAFGILLDGGGSVWMSGVSLEVVEESVPVTEFSQPPLPARLSNLDFRDPSSVPAPGNEGWIRAGDRPSEYEMGVDGAELDQGRPIAFVRSRFSTIDGFGTLMQMVSASPWRGKRLRFSARVRSTDVASWAGLWMRVDGKQGALLAFDNMRERAIKGTTAWQSYPVVLDVDPDAEGVAFGILLHGTGAVSISDVKLEVVDERAALTPQAPVTVPRNLDLTE
jgi:hypothetical protein